MTLKKAGATRGGQENGHGFGERKKACGSGGRGVSGFVGGGRWWCLDWELTLGWKAPCREPKETAGGRPGGRPGTAGGKAVYGCGEKGTGPSWGWRCSPRLVCPSILGPPP